MCLPVDSNLAVKSVTAFSPDPTFCRILEYCCPQCGTQIEAEYLPPGHPPTVDMIWDIDSLREKWEASGDNAEVVVNYGPGENEVTDFTARFESTGSHTNPSAAS